jgi:acyl-CoA thioesterase YciA
VTVKVGELIFRKPLRSGNHARIYGQVLALGNTSITLYMDVRRYNLYSAEESSVCTTTITFVRIDDDGTPTAIGDSIRRRHEMQIRGPLHG